MIAKQAAGQYLQRNEYDVVHLLQPDNTDLKFERAKGKATNESLNATCNNYCTIVFWQK